MDELVKDADRLVSCLAHKVARTFDLMTGASSRSCKYVLKTNAGICTLLSNHNLDIQSIRGQGYDGASNMRGKWNGLQALILSDTRWSSHLKSICSLMKMFSATCEVLLNIIEDGSTSFQ